MMLLRPVAPADHDALLSMAQKAGYGMTSLPQDADVLAEKITASVQSFADAPPKARDHRFLFVLETAGGEVVGSTGIKSHVGLSSPFYTYKISTLVQANEELGVYTLNRVLHMVNDYTSATEVGSLLLDERYRKSGWGKFLSRSRFLMMAQFPHLFDEVVIAEMRGVHDEEGNSPFYDHLARHFFKMSFREADYINATKGAQFIADLMPKYPIYVELLAEEAQAVIGEANAASLPAQALLEREGFAYVNYCDIFDAGPTLRAARGKIATVRESRLVTVKTLLPRLDAQEGMVSTTSLADLRMTRAPLRLEGQGVVMTGETAERLRVKAGDALRVAF